MTADVRTTVDLPQQMLVDLKTKAAIERTTVKQLVREAIAQYLQHSRSPSQPAWMRGFGAFENEKDDTKEVERVIQEEFSKVDLETWK